METRDVVIVGGGPAGLAAAVELYKKGIRNVLIVEREKTMAESCASVSTMVLV